jgi:surface polysaccharide O-acyltransferase-like enzyme
MKSIEKKENENYEKKRDSSIELLRIIGCISVISTHIMNIQIDENTNIENFPRIFNGCLCADGVAIFWYIMGFFFFNKISYKKRLNLLFKKIYIPIIITSFFYFYFYDFNFNNPKILSHFLKKTKKDYLFLFYNFLILEGGHLWFCYVYILIVILYPSFEGLNNLFEKYKINSYKIYFIFLAIFIENDFLNNKLLCVEHHNFNGVIGAIPFIFCGNELRKNIDKFKNKKFFSIFIFFYIGFNFLRTYLIIFTGKIYFIWWSTGFGIINGFCLFMIVYSFYDYLHYKFIYLIITKISSMTYYIYLIHKFVINNIFKFYKIDKKFYKKFYKNSKSMKGLIYYQTNSILFIFFISLIFSFGIDIFIKYLLYFKKLIEKKIKNN